MNEYDSQCITGQLMNNGFEQVDDIKKADVILFNTCAVREHAQQRFYTNLGATLELKEKAPEIIVGVCGCVAEQKKEKLFEKFPWVRLVIGPGNISLVGSAVKRIIENGSRISMTGNFDRADCLNPVRNGKSPAFVTIIRGCNNFCSYCVVPYLRGREQSRPMDEIIAEVKQLAEDGYKEVMLLGQNVCAYEDSRTSNVERRTSKSKNDFTRLLEEVNKIDGIEKIRFMTSHPRDVDDELIDAVASLDRVRKEFHLPVQSGSNKILKAMNRGYTKEYYLNLINSIHAKVPGIRITTDMIVGFPGETEEDFQETLNLVREIKFDDAFMFKYSDRPNTPAIKMENKMDEDIKCSRLEKLITAVRSSSY